MSATVVFLFAHQDDEFVVFRLLEQARDAGHKVKCVYLTNGNWNGADPKQRNAESVRVLSRLRLGPDSVVALGTELGIPDGSLAEQVARVEPALTRVLDGLGPIERIVMLSWEGGHQDHDAVHWLGVRQAKRLHIMKQCRQFPIYRAAPVKSWLPYLVAKPITANGPLVALKIPVLKRFFYVNLCRYYVTQKKAMIGLLPFLIFNYLTDGRQYTQGISEERLRHRPHDGPLLYEKRKRYSFEQMQAIFGQTGPIVARETE